MKDIFKNQKFLIVMDMDGTLLQTNQTIAPKTKALLQELSSYGNVISIASGRPGRSISKYSKALGLSGPFIGYNGALIENPYDPSFKPFRKWLKRDVIIDFLNHFGEDIFANLMLEDDTEQYYLRENDAYTYFFHPEGMNHHIGSVLTNLKNDVMTCVLELKDTTRKQEIKDYVASHYDNLSIRYWLDAPRFGEFHFNDTNKATSVNWLASYYGIDRAHVICFGDAMNDYQMVQSAGVSFAMKNGADELKKVATYVTEFDNNHEGIYHALVKFFRLDQE